MIKFEKVEAYKDVDFNLPTRKTKNSAGYDFEVAEDVKIPPYTTQYHSMTSKAHRLPKRPNLEDVAKYTKDLGAKPTLIPTGVKCYLNEGYYLELSMRSSTPLKYWIICANSVGKLLS